MKLKATDKMTDQEQGVLPEVLLGIFFRLIQAVKIHQSNNPIVTQSLKEFVETVQFSKIIIAPFEHHLKYDLSGYPQTNQKGTLSLHGRIISIADVYDALTSPRIYRDKVISPHRALEIMAKGAGTDFDPILLKVFIKMLGIYPIGTLLKLDSGEIGLVTESSKEADPLRPRVVLLEPVGKNRFKRGKTASLSEKNVGSTTYKRSILGSHHPCLQGMQPAQYLIWPANRPKRQGFTTTARHDVGPQVMNRGSTSVFRQVLSDPKRSLR